MLSQVLEAGSAELHSDKYHDPEYQKVHIELFSKSIIEPLEPILPPGVKQHTYDAAMSEWAAVVGEKCVHRQNDVEEYIDPYEMNENLPLRKVPSGAICPGSADEVREVLRIATKHGIPLWVFSRGKNLGYGGPAPRLSGSVALDLHRMNKIIEVNEKFSYAVVEPGVTFTDLYDYCKANKLRVWPSTPSLGWGSVIGNTLDRGTGFTPTATHHQNMAGLEVILADGDVVRTGQFAISNSDAAHLSKFTFGPSIEGLFLQSNLGVVTKMGIWLTPQPEAYASCFFEMPELEDIEVLTEAFGSMRQNGTIPNTVFVSNIIEVLAMFNKRADLYSGPGPIPPHVLKALQKQHNLGYWNCKWGLFGPRRILQAQVDEIQSVLNARAPTGTFRFEMFSGEKHELLEASNIPEPHGGPFVGVPTLWSLPMVKFRLPAGEKGIAGHGDFSSIIPSDGKSTLEWIKQSQRICEKYGFDLFCDFFMHERHLIFVNFQPFDKTQAWQQKAIQAIFAEMYEEAKAKGFSNYRSHVNHMDAIANLYDFNDHAYKRFVEKLKDTLDPDAILSPGKQGIWGQKFAGQWDPHDLLLRHKKTLHSERVGTTERRPSVSTSSNASVTKASKEGDLGHAQPSVLEEPSGGQGARIEARVGHAAANDDVVMDDVRPTASIDEVHNLPTDIADYQNTLGVLPGDTTDAFDAFTSFGILSPYFDFGYDPRFVAASISGHNPVPAVAPTTTDEPVLNRQGISPFRTTDTRGVRADQTDVGLSPPEISCMPQAKRAPLEFTDAARDRLLEDLAGRLPDNEGLPNDVPPASVLSKDINSFMDSFNTHLPIFHLPTMDFAEMRSPLVLAICAIGALHLLDRSNAGTMYTLSRKALTRRHQRAELELASVFWDWSKPVAARTKTEPPPLWDTQTQLLLAYFGSFCGHPDVVVRSMEEIGSLSCVGSLSSRRTVD
ncbi:Vanillyl-alcohol oxidase [Cyphellophora attinorum]|uniref:Vanillyl-alcohol oxidase n=1 Tax=Cyphellophora attinorum TaxID=1664694 RepID=A0A0N1NYD5_9EURO|nr:Vanillyl-alcohol oxidase [Phialophora attinorum]KPI39612.1 Vanillyl-alcohol oxidase [Phialophora attinorum]